MVVEILRRSQDLGCQFRIVSPTAESRQPVVGDARFRLAAQEVAIVGSDQPVAEFGAGQEAILHLGGRAAVVHGADPAVDLVAKKLCREQKNHERTSTTLPRGLAAKKVTISSTLDLHGAEISL